MILKSHPLVALALLLATATATPAKNPDAGNAFASGLLSGRGPVSDYNVFAGDSRYPSELADKGVQGDALIHAKVQADGRLVEPTLARSSHSDALDQSALQIAATMGFQPAKGQEVEREIEFKVVFVRDTLETVVKKSCAEFNTDLAYYQSTYPERKAGDMPVFKLSTGAIIALRGFELERIKRLKAMPDAVAAACAKDPQAKFFEQVVKILG
jgi:TonB family protein